MTSSRVPTAVAYHELTKYSEQELLRNQRSLDFARKPPVWKTFPPEDARVSLVPWLPFPKDPFTGRPLETIPLADDGGVGLPEISRLLFFTYGMTAAVRYPNEVHLLRAAPSAGALYPTEIYVATRGVPGLVDGVHDYQVKDHSLVTMWEGDFWQDFKRDAYGHEAIDASRVLILFSGVFERSAWRYHERAYRRVLLDTGHALGNLMAFAPEDDLLVYPISGFCDAALNGLLFLDQEEEGMLMVCAVARPSDLAGTSVRRSSVCPSPMTRVSLADVDEHRLIQRLHDASAIPPGDAFSEGRLPDDTPLSLLCEGAAETVLGTDVPTFHVPKAILSRRSTRAYSGGTMDRKTLAGILAYGYEVAVPPEGLEDAGLPRVFDPCLIETYVIVHGVEDVMSGAYAYVPRTGTLRLIRAGDFRGRAQHFCLGQELGSTASAVVIHASDLPRAIEKYGERAYRYLHLDAGHLGQRMNVAATALGAGASGIGGFFDDEVNALLGLPLDKIVVYITTLGLPSEG